MVTVVISTQNKKAKRLIRVTELGITTDSPEHSLKANLPMETTESGITLFLHPAINSFVEDLIIALQLFRES